MRILIVDDELEILSIVSSFLADRGYDCVTASTGDEALELVETDFEIRLVLLDVVMPGSRDGIQTLRDLMQLVPHPQVIMMTARADEKIFEAVRNGAVDYVLKPIDFEALEETVGASLNRSASS